MQPTEEQTAAQTDAVGAREWGDNASFGAFVACRFPFAMSKDATVLKFTGLSNLGLTMVARTMHNPWITYAAETASLALAEFCIHPMRRSSLPASPEAEDWSLATARP